MRRTGLVVATVALALVAAVATAASPASAQMTGNGPAESEYQVTEGGTLVVGGDVEVPCSTVGRRDPSVRKAAPAVRAEMERSIRAEIRACRDAGFPTFSADGDTDGSLYSPHASGSSGASAVPGGGGVLPQTGGAAFPGLVAGAGLVVASGALLALHARRRS